MKSIFFTCLALFVSCPMVVAEQVPGNLVEPESVTKIIDNGQHNAFTAMVHWQGAYWIAFRSGPGHHFAEADIVILRSIDGKSWAETSRINALEDDRDPQFVAMDDRLLLYISSIGTNEKMASFVTYTEDGINWSVPQEVYQPQFILWKPVVHNGAIYATAHRKSKGGDDRKVHLVKSTDGFDWDYISTIREGNWESETTIHFEPDDSITAYLRQKWGAPKSFILTSVPPYDEWSQRQLDVKLAGHHIEDFLGTTYLFSRTVGPNGTGTMIYTVKAGVLTPYCQLPAGGDCSYPSAVLKGDKMLVCYYSSHEGATSIYLATVPLAPSAILPSVKPAN